VATSGSPESAEYCARKGFIPLYFNSIKTALVLSAAHDKALAATGREVKRGMNQAIVRMPHIGKTHAEAEESVMRHDADIFRNFYAAMGQHRVPSENVVEAVIRNGMWTLGTVDEVRQQMVAEWKQLPCEYLTLIYHYAQMPKERVIDNLAAFMRHVKPALDELTE
jgi:alkanesulfonate monooxygenase SsuD/methylene tetrahydromethanopterin reductase-like flavin-dependent oxidoreductase (luciferase family)